MGTDLESCLRAATIQTVVICGATRNHCVETTTRMVGNLGFDTWLVKNATWTFGRVGPDGDIHSDEEIHAMTLANLRCEFARIVGAIDMIQALGVGSINGAYQLACLFRSVFAMPLNSNRLLFDAFILPLRRSCLPPCGKEKGDGICVGE